MQSGVTLFAKLVLTLSWLQVHAATAVATTPLDLRLLTYNIRYATTSPGTGEQPWSARRPRMHAQLVHETAGRAGSSLLCMQEVLRSQLMDLLSDLSSPTTSTSAASDWAHIGVGRDDGVNAGEFSPILYQTTAWTVERSRTFWLSPTPDVAGSKGWDAALPRIATAARLRHVVTGKLVVLVCTHFDNAGQRAREESARLLVRLAGQVAGGVGLEDVDFGSGSGSGRSTAGQAAAGAVPVFVAGDLNSTPDNAAYKSFVAAGAMRDAKDLVPARRRYGNSKTYTAFTTSTSDDSLLDHVFVKNETGIEFASYAVLPNRFDDDPVFISDHRPVVVDVRIST